MSNEVLKGTGASRLTQAIRRAGYNDYDRFELATITAALPSITIKVDNNPLVLDAGDVIIAEHLTEHTRKVTITATDVAEAMTSAGYTPHTHDITSMTFTLADMVVKSPLHVGDRVIVVSSDGGQTYVILDKAVTL